MSTRNSIHFRAALEVATVIAKNAVSNAFVNAQGYVTEDVCAKAMAASEALADLYSALRKLNGKDETNLSTDRGRTEE